VRNPNTIQLTDDQIAALSYDLIDDVFEIRDKPGKFEIFCVPFKEYKKVVDELEALKKTTVRAVQGGVNHNSLFRPGNITKQLPNDK